MTICYDRTGSSVPWEDMDAWAFFCTSYSQPINDTSEEVRARAVVEFNAFNPSSQFRVINHALEMGELQAFRGFHLMKPHQVFMLPVKRRVEQDISTQAMRSAILELKKAVVDNRYRTLAISTPSDKLNHVNILANLLRDERYSIWILERSCWSSSPS